MIEDYSIDLQLQGKHVIILLPVLEEDNVHFVFKCFLYCMCIDLDWLSSNGSVNTI